MPLLRTYDPARGKIVVTLESAYRDRLARWSDIQEYLPFLREQARSRPAVRVLELGSRKGNSTLAFLAGAKESGGHVWSCDVTPVDRDPAGMLPWARHPQAQPGQPPVRQAPLRRGLGQGAAAVALPLRGLVDLGHGVSFPS